MIPGRCKKCGNLIKEDDDMAELLSEEFYKCWKCNTINKINELLPV